jgi:hypothetical protein
MALEWRLGLTSANLTRPKSQIHREGEAVDGVKPQVT